MREVFTRINGLPFCRGENDRGWRANFDWALKPANIAKVLEGVYASTRSRSAPDAATDVAKRERMDRLLARPAAVGEVPS